MPPEPRYKEENHPESYVDDEPVDEKEDIGLEILRKLRTAETVMPKMVEYVATLNDITIDEKAGMRLHAAMEAYQAVGGVVPESVSSMCIERIMKYLIDVQEWKNIVKVLSSQPTKGEPVLPVSVYLGDCKHVFRL